jgi:hypothetical protein
MNNFNQAAPSGRDSFAQNKGQPHHRASQTHPNHSARPARPQAALLVVQQQADEVQSIARQLLQEGYAFAPLELMQRLARVVVVCGLLAEKISAGGLQ